MITVSESSSSRSSFADRITEAVVVPAAIVTVPGRSKSLDTAVLVAAEVNVTVTTFADTALNVTFTVVLVADVFSLILVDPLIESVATGGAVPSTIVTVCGVLAPTVTQVASHVIPITTVSESSSNASTEAESVTFAVVVPAAIVIVVELNVKSVVVAVLEDATDNVTVTVFAETVSNVAVTNVEVAPVSLMLPLTTDNVTFGASVSSTIVTVCGVLVATVVHTDVSPHVIAIITVSDASSNASSFAVNTTDPVVPPASIVIVVESNPKSVDVAVLVANVVSVTVTVFAEITLNVAVTAVLI